MPEHRPPDDLPTISTTQWLILTLVIEKPSYGYEIGKRYDRRFGSFLPTSRSTIYNGLDRFQQVELVEPQQSLVGTANGFRGLQVTYRPTRDASLAHGGWLSAPVESERWRQQMLARIGSAYLHGPRPRARFSPDTPIAPTYMSSASKN